MEFWLSKQGKEHNGAPKVPQKKKTPPPSSGQIRKLPLKFFFLTRILLTIHSAGYFTFP